MVSFADIQQGLQGRTGLNYSLSIPLPTTKFADADDDMRNRGDVTPKSDCSTTTHFFKGQKSK